MSKQEKDSLMRMNPVETIFFLLLIPLAFTFTIHYLSSVNQSYNLRKEISVVRTNNNLAEYVKDEHSMRKIMLFYSPKSQDKKTTKNSVTYPYDFPLIGQREVKFLKSKEETRLASQEEMLHTVIDPIT